MIQDYEIEFLILLALLGERSVDIGAATPADATRSRGFRLRSERLEDLFVRNQVGNFVHQFVYFGSDFGEKVSEWFLAGGGL